MDARAQAPAALPALASRRGDAVAAALLTVAMAATTALLVRPAIGIDDANITQVYAANLAAGHGYVYNPGGERVEGSTSALWTLVNTLAFLIAPARAEMLIAAVSALLTAVTVLLSLRLARLGAGLLGVPERAAATATLAAFALVPGFFVWSVWTLMDLVLWTCLLAWLALSLATALARGAAGAEVPRPAAAGLVLAAAFVPLTRPEGAAVAAGLAALVLLHGALAGSRPTLRLGAAALAVALAATAAITLWRLSVFGYPLPNTVYAKVSTGWLAQFAGGLRYAIDFLRDPANGFGVGLVTGLALARLVAAGSPGAALRSPAAMALTGLACYVWGLVLLYAAAGGDHFGSFRFYQPLVPVLVPALGLAAAFALERLAPVLRPGRAGPVALATLAAVVALPHAATFAVWTGGLAREFRIAEEGRAAGAVLARLEGPEGPPSVGVIAAGGFRRTHAGVVHDLMGLNWVRMAHAVDDLTGAPRNHGGFDREVFYDTLPDILIPRFAPCRAADFPGANTMRTLKGLPEDARFRELYAPACHGGLIFYARRDLMAREPALAPAG